MSAPVYQLQLSPDGSALLCTPPGPCVCGRVAALFVVTSHGHVCSDCARRPVEVKP